MQRLSCNYPVSSLPAPEADENDTHGSTPSRSPGSVKSTDWIVGRLIRLYEGPSTLQSLRACKPHSRDLFCSESPEELLGAPDLLILVAWSLSRKREARSPKRFVLMSNRKNSLQVSEWDHPEPLCAIAFTSAPSCPLSSSECPDR